MINRGKWGVEAQIIEAPDDLRIGHRFDHREQAVRWVESMRGDMERWDFDLPVADSVLRGSRPISVHHVGAV